jgi:acyl-CoA thioesterase FadM
MARIKLQLPDAFPFRTELAVRVTDLNYGGHLGNDAVLGLLHEARVRFLAALGFTELDAEGKRDGAGPGTPEPGRIGLLMADCAIVYKAQGFLGDRLIVAVAAGEWSRVGCDLFYRITRADGAELVRAKTAMVCFDYAAQAVREVPEAFRLALS